VKEQSGKKHCVGRSTFFFPYFSFCIEKKNVVAPHGAKRCAGNDNSSKISKNHI